MKTTPIIYKPANEQDMEEFIRHLVDCGYKNDDEFLTGNENRIMTFPYSVRFQHIKNPPTKIIGCVGCGDNLELAKALSALDDETDYMQWMIGVDGEWQLWKRMLCVYEGIICVKATKEELIERFANLNP